MPRAAIAARGYAEEAAASSIKLTLAAPHIVRITTLPFPLSLPLVMRYESMTRVCYLCVCVTHVRCLRVPHACAALCVPLCVLELLPTTSRELSKGISALSCIVFVPSFGVGVGVGVCEHSVSVSVNTIVYWILTHSPPEHPQHA